MFLFSARMKKFQSEMKALEWSQHFSHCKSIGISSDAQGQLTPQSVVGFDQISNSFKLSCMSSLFTCNNEDDSIKNEGARVVKKLFPMMSMGIFPDNQGQLTPQSMVGFG